MLIGGEFNLTKDEIEQVACIALSVSETRQIVDMLDGPERFITALDQAQGDSRIHDEPQYILVRIQ